MGFAFAKQIIGADLGRCWKVKVARCEGEIQAPLHRLYVKAHYDDKRNSAAEKVNVVTTTSCRGGEVYHGDELIYEFIEYVYKSA